jgi:hypothetical protein
MTNRQIENPFIIVPESRLSDLGHSKDDNWARLTPTSDQILAVPEIFVQLQCLNFLRQQTYRDDYNYSSLPGFQGSEEEVMLRVDKCIQRLRQTLMCAADATPFLYEILPGPGRKTNSDFETLHYCRSFEAIQKWTGENGLSHAALDAWPIQSSS